MAGRYSGMSVTTRLDRLHGLRRAPAGVERAECQIRIYLQWVVSDVAKMSMKPVWSNTVPSIVIVPANSANLSVVVDLVVQFPDLVVDRVTVVEIGPDGVSLADTVTVLVDVQVRLLQLSSGI
jgi:hypothetical protein